MKTRIKAISLIIFIMIPNIKEIMLGYGKLEQVASNLFQLFFVCLIVLLLYLFYLFFHVVKDLFCKRVNKYKFKFLVLFCILLLTLIIDPLLAKPLRRLGASLRLWELGDDVFIEELLSDLDHVIMRIEDKDSYISGKFLPNSFKKLGAESARIYCFDNFKRADISTSGRPYHTGWIVLTKNDYAEVDGIKVSKYIFRY